MEKVAAATAAKIQRAMSGLSAHTTHGLSERVVRAAPNPSIESLNQRTRRHVQTADT